MSELTWDALDELIARTRASVIRKLDEATDWPAVLADINQRAQREPNDADPQPRSTA